MATHNVCNDPRGVTPLTNGYAVEMAVFDKLPKKIRQALANANWPYAPSGVADIRKKYGFTIPAVLRLIAENDRYTSAAYCAKFFGKS